MKKIKKIAIVGAVLGCSALLVSNSFANEDSDVNNDHNSTTTNSGSYNPETKTFKDKSFSEYKESMYKKYEMKDEHGIDRKPEMGDDHGMDKKPEMKEKREEYKKDYSKTYSGSYENQDKMNYFKGNMKAKQGLKDMYIKQLREKYSTLINNIPSEKLSLVLDKINSKIDSITNSDLKQDTKEKSLAMLNALVVLINERLDSFDTDSLVQDLLK